jgi:hypothetical protein
MLQAQLKGKLTREEENLEDLLTSNVFGSIKYLPPEEGLLPILASSINIVGNAPAFALQPISNVKYEFWQGIKEPKCKGCEPDVLITLQLMNGQKIIVLVEAKYLSDKSSTANEEEAPEDQLACEWDNLLRLSERQKAIPILLYVTADFGYPRKSIEDSRTEYVRKRKEDMSVFWISWRKLPKLFSGKKQDILDDLVEVLQRQGLTFFEGISKPKLPDVKWPFKAMVNWNWSSYKECSFGWKYLSAKTYNWQYKVELAKWRFGD